MRGATLVGPTSAESNSSSASPLGANVMVPPSQATVACGGASTGVGTFGSDLAMNWSVCRGYPLVGHMRSSSPKAQDKAKLSSEDSSPARPTMDSVPRWRTSCRQQTPPCARRSATGRKWYAASQEPTSSSSLIAGPSRTSTIVSPKRSSCPGATSMERFHRIRTHVPSSEAKSRKKYWYVWSLNLISACFGERFAFSMYMVMSLSPLSLPKSSPCGVRLT
mmetsp:Transcript_68809/g.224150  ORF Transcript_68809/g.224150 Transcript_68809/m.224150 type:complete len:221 (+) Transcript_68809:1093-1755(+)